MRPMRPRYILRRWKGSIEETVRRVNVGYFDFEARGLTRLVVLATGGRGYTDDARIRRVMNSLQPGLVIHGDCAEGVDGLVDLWAYETKVHVARVPALWDAFGSSAGPLRNEKMLKLSPEFVVAFPGDSGTANMVGLAAKARIPTLECLPLQTSV